MGLPMDYGSYASTYASARFAYPFLVEPLAEVARRTRPGAHLVEIGCGTGNYLEALRRTVPERGYAGFDLSREMVGQASRRGPRGGYLVANADQSFPLKSGSVALAFVVDVLHHLTDYASLFREVARILEPAGAFVAFTDSEDNLRRRSLTRFFPEVLEVELRRYPNFHQLEGFASAAGLREAAPEPAEGHIELDESFIAKLEAKCSSAMRLIPDAAHRRGMERVRAASRRGERWLSSYSMLRFSRP